MHSDGIQSQVGGSYDMADMGTSVGWRLFIGPGS